LINTDSETYKLFCAIFNLPQGCLFEEDGSIRQEVWVAIPTDLYESMVIVEIKKQERVEFKNMQEKNRQRVNAILTNSLNISCDENFILSSSEIPPEITKIFATIRRGGKVIARTSFTSQEMPIDLKKCSFEPFPSLGKGKNIPWSQLSNWKAAERHTVEVE
jgi:hypothetical protein